MADEKRPAPQTPSRPVAVSDSAMHTGEPLKPAQPPIEDPGEEAPGGLDVPTGD